MLASHANSTANKLQLQIQSCTQVGINQSGVNTEYRCGSLMYWTATETLDNIACASQKTEGSWRAEGRGFPTDSAPPPLPG